MKFSPRANYGFGVELSVDYELIKNYFSLPCFSGEELIVEHQKAPSIQTESFSFYTIGQIVSIIISHS